MMSLTIKVSGKVQGVFFRASCKERADQLGVKGFVRNEFDGGVYIEVTGDSHSVSQFVEWCKIGSPQAVVNEVKIDEVPLKGFPSSFSIKR